MRGVMGAVEADAIVAVVCPVDDFSVGLSDRSGRRSPISRGKNRCENTRSPYHTDSGPPPRSPRTEPPAPNCGRHNRGIRDPKGKQTPAGICLFSGVSLQIHLWPSQYPPDPEAPSFRGVSVPLGRPLLEGYVSSAFSRVPVNRVYHKGSRLSVVKVRYFLWRKLDTFCGAS